MEYQYQGFNYESYPGGSVVDQSANCSYRLYTAMIKPEENPEATYVYQQNNFVVNQENQETWYSPASSSSDQPEEEPQCSLQELTTMVPHINNVNVIPQENYAYNNVMYATGQENANATQYMLPNVSYVQPEQYANYEAPYVTQYVAPIITNEQILPQQQDAVVNQPSSSSEGSNASEYFSSCESSNQVIEDKDTGKFTCNTCGRKFTKACYLTQHKNAKHDDERTHKCQKCGKMFTTIKFLEAHCKKHNENKPHKCTLCQKEYNFRADLTRHMFVHNKKNSPFVCTVCGKGFARKDHLKNHYLVHNKKTAVKVR